MVTSFQEPICCLLVEATSDTTSMPQVNSLKSSENQ